MSVMKKKGKKIAHLERPQSFDIPRHSPVRTPTRNANNSRSTRHSGIQQWSIKPRTKFPGMPENKNMCAQRLTYVTPCYYATVATDDAHWAGGWVAVHTKRKRRSISQGLLSHIIAMYKKEGMTVQQLVTLIPRMQCPVGKPFGWEGRRLRDAAAVL